MSDNLTNNSVQLSALKDSKFVKKVLYLRGIGVLNFFCGGQFMYEVIGAASIGLLFGAVAGSAGMHWYQKAQMTKLNRTIEQVAKGDYKARVSQPKGAVAETSQLLEKLN